MVQKRRLVMWAFASAGIAAFVLGASAQEVVRAISQAVVTPANPIWAQEVPAPPTPQEGDITSDNAGGGRGNGKPEDPPTARADRRTLDGVWSQRSVIDYGLARRATLTSLLGAGAVTREDACDAHPYLLLAARHHGEPTGR